LAVVRTLLEMSREMFEIFRMRHFMASMYPKFPILRQICSVSNVAIRSTSKYGCLIVNIMKSELCPPFQ
jgi:hypothetical protein